MAVVYTAAAIVSPSKLIFALLLVVRMVKPPKNCKIQIIYIILILTLYSNVLTCLNVHLHVKVLRSRFKQAKKPGEEVKNMELELWVD